MNREYIRKLDKDLISIKSYCHPDAPKEFIVISENVVVESGRDYTKSVEAVLIRDRYVEIIRDPLLGGKLEVVIKRDPKNTLLTYSEVFEILQEVTRKLGVEIKWKRPFPRGSC